jgi:uncharacterized 2Fe-2S/4Fe-4S cluster protein (DUF4445 family)
MLPTQIVAPGAIERVRIDPEMPDVRFSVIGSELRLDDPAFADSIEAFGVTGICGSGIIEAVAEIYLNGIISEDGVVDGSLAERTKRVIPEDRTWSFVLHDGEQLISVTKTTFGRFSLPKLHCTQASSC